MQFWFFQLPCKLVRIYFNIVHLKKAKKYNAMDHEYNFMVFFHFLFRFHLFDCL